MVERRRLLLGMALCVVLSFGYYIHWFKAFAFPQAAFQFRTEKTSTLTAQIKQITACIFTSFKDSQQKEPVYKNTIRNWSLFLPDIQPVLFSTNMSSHITTFAEAYGWKVGPCSKTNEFGTPFLKEMYISAYDLVNASFYGFSNGDILFDAGLLLSLKKIHEETNILNTTLIIGRRWHYKMKPNDDLGNFTLTHIKSLADIKFSEYGSGIGEDFFFVNKHFPWMQIKDVVIGRPAYDNYLVARAINLNVSTVDVTKTVSAIHQVEKGRLSGFRNKDSYYNNKVIGKFSYGKGNIDNAWFRTQFDYKGDVVLMNQKISAELSSEFCRKFSKMH